MAGKKHLIDIEQATRATFEELFWTESEQASVRNFLLKLPKVDAVEVVWCKDCKSCKMCYPEKQIDKEATPGWYCKKHKAYRSPDDYCSFGERKGND